MKDKLIKQMDKKEASEYRHEYYLRHREQQLKERKEYYRKHREEILLKAKNHYRIKCGLPPLNNGGNK